jgi:hypothetical protein
MKYFGITMSEIIDTCKISLHTSKDRIKTKKRKTNETK